MFDEIKTTWRQKNGVCEMVQSRYIIKGSVVLGFEEVRYFPRYSDSVVGYIKSFDSGRAMSAFNGEILEHDNIIEAKKYADAKYSVTYESEAFKQETLKLKKENN